LPDEVFEEGETRPQKKEKSKKRKVEPDSSSSDAKRAI
jgi:poly(A) polymerase Pap1